MWCGYDRAPGIRLPDLANIWNMLTIIFLIWKSNFKMCPVFYLASLLGWPGVLKPVCPCWIPKRETEMVCGCVDWGRRWMWSWNQLGSFQWGSEKLRYRSSSCQHGEESSESKVVDKKWFMRIKPLWGLQADGWEVPPELRGLQFYNQTKSGEGKKTFFVSLE